MDTHATRKKKTVICTLVSGAYVFSDVAVSCHSALTVSQQLLDGFSGNSAPTFMMAILWLPLQRHNEVENVCLEVKCQSKSPCVKTINWIRRLRLLNTASKVGTSPQSWHESGFCSVCDRKAQIHGWSGTSFVCPAFGFSSLSLFLHSLLLNACFPSGTLLQQRNMPVVSRGAKKCPGPSR